METVTKRYRVGYHAYVYMTQHLRMPEASAIGALMRAARDGETQWDDINVQVGNNEHGTPITTVQHPKQR